MAAFTGERIFIVIDKIHSYHIAILKYLGLWLSFLIILCLNLKKKHQGMKIKYEDWMNVFKTIGIAFDIYTQ